MTTFICKLDVTFNHFDNIIIIDSGMGKTKHNHKQNKTKQNKQKHNKTDRQTNKQHIKSLKSYELQSKI